MLRCIAFYNVPAFTVPFGNIGRKCEALLGVSHVEKRLLFIHYGLLVRGVSAHINPVCSDKIRKNVFQ